MEIPISSTTSRYQPSRYFTGQVLKNVKTNFNLVTNEFLYVDEKGCNDDWKYFND